MSAKLGMSDDDPMENLKNFLAFRDDNSQTIEILKENLAGEKLTPFSLDMVKVPSGGNTAWEVPSLDGAQPEKTIEGIILHNQYYRGMWSVAYGGDDAGPPQCYSWEVGGHGTGDPGGDCNTCPFNEWGTATDASGGARAGKACQERRFLFVLRPDVFLPLVIQIPATSMMSVRNYGLRLGNEKGLRTSQVLTEFSLVKEKRGGFDTAIVKPSVKAYLSPEECAKVSKMAQEFMSMVSTINDRVVSQGAFLNDEEDS